MSATGGADGSVWQGPRVRLRAFTIADAPVYRAWDDDSEQARALWEIPFPRSPSGDRAWADAEAARVPDGDNRRLVIADRAGLAVGDLTVHDCDPRVGTFSYGVSVGAADRGQGYATEAIGLLLRYMFEERRYQRAWVTIAAWNAPSITLHERLGFTLEGRLRRMAYTRGQHHDQLVYGLLREEWTPMRPGDG